MARKRNRSHGRLKNYFCTCGSWHTSHSGLMNHIGHYEREPDGDEEVEDDDEFVEEDSDDDDDDWDDWDDDDDDWDDWDDDNGWDPEEESYETEDMPGDTPEDREEAYDNIDWDARD